MNTIKYIIQYEIKNIDGQGNSIWSDWYVNSDIAKTIQQLNIESEKQPKTKFRLIEETKSIKVLNN